MVSLHLIPPLQARKCIAHNLITLYPKHTTQHHTLRTQEHFRQVLQLYRRHAHVLQVCVVGARVHHGPQHGPAAAPARSAPRTDHPGVRPACTLHHPAPTPRRLVAADPVITATTPIDQSTTRTTHRSIAKQIFAFPRERIERLRPSRFVFQLFQRDSDSEISCRHVYRERTSKLCF